MIDTGTSKPTPSRIADALEATVLFDPSGVVSRATLADWLGEEGGIEEAAEYDETGGDDGELATEALRGERGSRRLARAEGIDEETTLADATFEELGRRAEIASVGYPFDVTPRLLRRLSETWEDAPVYSFLLALNSRWMLGLTADLNVGARAFERLVVPALQAYWCGEAAHFGWPRDPAEEGSFRGAIATLVRLMRETMIVRPEDIPTRLRDLEVDVVAWRPLDRRPGQTVMLCQCAIGDEWDQKGIHVELWEPLIHFRVRPTRGLAFPFVPDSVREMTDLEWSLLCGRVGVPLDRLRLAGLLADRLINADLLATMSAWTTTLLPQLIPRAR